ncbi:MAG: double-cubane-cluster-containing anaerobic reductase [Armatimonadota bacterium]|nr:2-hydroxyacyl-CoA dehydratase family protein [bacterium]
MSKCSGDKQVKAKNCDPCSPPSVDCCSSAVTTEQNDSPTLWFENMIDNCYDYAIDAKSNSRPIVGIMCEYAPRELIMAAGGVPVCLCGGSAKTIPAAEDYLPANLCPLIKSTFGYHITKTNPFLEMADLVVAETTCDGKKKMFELMAETKAVHLMELPQKQDDSEAFEHWVTEIHKLKAELETRFDVQITPEKIREASRIMNRERNLRRGLAGLMKADAPPLTGRQLLNFKSIISGIPTDLEKYEEAAEILRSHSRNGDMSSRVRVLLTGVPVVHGAERVVDIIEESGGLIVCMENCTGLKPILEDVDLNAADPIRALAKKYFHIHCAVMTRNTRRIDYLRALTAEYRAECVIDLVWQACVTYDIESYQVRRLAEQELHVPYLRIETDYSPSDSARIAVRVEALFETLRSSYRTGQPCRK